MSARGRHAPGSHHETGAAERAAASVLAVAVAVVQDGHDQAAGAYPNHRRYDDKYDSQCVGRNGPSPAMLRARRIVAAARVTETFRPAERHHANRATDIFLDRSFSQHGSGNLAEEPRKRERGQSSDHHKRECQLDVGVDVTVPMQGIWRSTVRAEVGMACDVTFTITVLKIGHGTFSKCSLAFRQARSQSILHRIAKYIIDNVTTANSDRLRAHRRADTRRDRVCGMAALTRGRRFVTVVHVAQIVEGRAPGKGGEQSAEQPQALEGAPSGTGVMRKSHRMVSMVLCGERFAGVRVPDGSHLAAVPMLFEFAWRVARTRTEADRITDRKVASPRWSPAVELAALERLREHAKDQS